MDPARRIAAAGLGSRMAGTLPVIASLSVSAAAGREGGCRDHRSPGRYQIVSMDCPDDVAMMEKAVRSVTGVTDA